MWLHRHRRLPRRRRLTRLFSDIVGPEGRVYSFVPAEVAHFKNDPVGRMRTLAKEPGRENVEAVSADLVAMPEATQPAAYGCTCSTTISTPR
jgi:predicted methyltransferase